MLIIKSTLLNAINMLRTKYTQPLMFFSNTFIINSTSYNHRGRIFPCTCVVFL